MCSLIGLPFSSFLCLDSRIIHFGEFLVLKWKFRAVLTASDLTFTTNRRHFDFVITM